MSDQPQQPTSEAKPISPAVLESIWEAALDDYRDWKVNVQKREKSGATRYRSSLKKIFVPWAIERQLTPDALKPELMAEFEPHMIEHGGVGANLSMLRSAAKELMRGEWVKKHIASSTTAEPEGEEEEPAAEEEGEEVTDEEIYDDADDEAPQSAPPYRQQRAPAPMPPQVQPVVFQVSGAAPRGRRQPQDPNAPSRRGPALNPFQRQLREAATSQQRFRLFKYDDAGAKVYINDFSMSDLGGRGHLPFVKENVDPNFGNASGKTRYEACSVDQNDNEITPGVVFNIESDPKYSEPDPLDKVERLHELTTAMEQKSAQQNQMFMKALEAKAANPNNSMTDMMGLMMMSTMFNKQKDSPDIEKLVDKLTSNPALQSMPAMSPPPPTASPLEGLVTTLVEKLIPSPSATPAQPTSQLSMLKELGEVMNLFRPAQPQTDPNVLALLTKMDQRMADLERKQSSNTSTVDGFVATAGQVMKVVKDLAPVLGAGEGAGLFKNLMTPAVQQVLGNGLAGILSKLVTAPAPVPAPAPAAPAPAPTAQPAPPPTSAVPQRQVPMTAIPHFQRLQAAQTEADQIDAICQGVAALYMDATWKPVLEPHLMSLMSDNFAHAGLPIQGILADVRPDLNKPEFISKVLTKMKEILMQRMTEAPPAPAVAPVEAPKTEPALAVTAPVAA